MAMTKKQRRFENDRAIKEAVKDTLPVPVVTARKSAPFRWGPISEKQFAVLTWWKTAADRFDGIIGDGSIRSGKTVAFAFSFVEWSMTTFDGELFGIAGKTIGALRMNVVEPLKRILRSRSGYFVKESLQRNLLIVRYKGRTNTFELFGGKDEASKDTIQGRTLAGILFDEAPLMPESFVDQAIARCSIRGSKFWFTSNPEHPRHWFKIRFIDQAAEKRFLYLHFTMSDNLSLSPEIVKRYEALYIGTWRLRYVKGLWVAAEGAVYDMYSPTDNELDNWEGRKLTPDDRFVAVDYGTMNPCVFLDITLKAGVYCIEREYYFDSRAAGYQRTDAKYSTDMKDFLGVDRQRVRIVVDPSAASLIAALKGDGFKVEKAENEVLDGIRTVQLMMSERRLRISRTGCPRLLDEIGAYKWNPKASSSGQDAPVKEFDHAVDAMRYGVFTKEESLRRTVRFVDNPL